MISAPFFLKNPKNLKNPGSDSGFVEFFDFFDASVTNIVTSRSYPLIGKLRLIGKVLNNQDNFYLALTL